MKDNRALRIASILAVLILVASAAFGQSGSKVDVNTASQAEIESLPGIGKKTATKIIANRPYSSAAELSKAGLSARKIDKISPLLDFGNAGAASASTPVPEAISSPPAATKRHAKAPVEAATGETQAAQTPPSPGMVWVNTKTKIYHTEGDRFYGKTKNGKWMTEEDATKAGYRKSKQD